MDKFGRLAGALLVGALGLKVAFLMLQTALLSR